MSRIELTRIFQEVHDLEFGHLRTAQSPVGLQKPILSRLLDTVGDGSGTTNAVGTYGAPTSFKIVPPAGSIYRINRIIVNYTDAGAFDSTKYGNGITLTNGIIVQHSDAGGVVNVFTPDAVKTNADWGKYCYDVTYYDWGVGNKAMGVRWTLGKSGQMLRLVGDDGDFFECVLEDNYAGLVTHNFCVQGFVES